MHRRIADTSCRRARAPRSVTRSIARVAITASVSLCLSIGAAACGEQPSKIGRVDAAAVDPTEWEEHFLDDELGAFAEGQVVTSDAFMRGSDDEVVAGARVELWAVTPDGIRFDRKLAEVETGPDGRFRVGPAALGLA
jgi:hypothetical protein